MDTTLTFDRGSAEPLRATRMPIADDRAMLKAAAELTRDIIAPRPRIYWVDMLASAALGYAALAGAMLASSLPLALLFGVVAMFALYRASMFIHEITHLKHSQVPGFRLGWNLVVGIPLMVPSFMYEGVHNLHHARTRYGTAEDPEYLPLALMKPWTLPVFVLVSVLAPIALLFRYAVLTPLSLLIPPLRRLVVAKYSGLQINPSFERRPPEGELRSWWHGLEAGASVWSIALLTMVATGVVPLRAFLIFLGVAAGLTLINQIRTLVAHLWENEGDAMTVTAQYLDTVNVPPPGFLPLLWAPVGLRYHALHHLIPSLPYHSLAEAHRRLVRALEPDSPYHKGNYRSLTGLVVRIGASTMKLR